MFCTQCGNQIPDGVSFCPQCGSPLGNAAAAAAGAAAAGFSGANQPQSADYVHSSSRAQEQPAGAYQSAQQQQYTQQQYAQSQYAAGPATGTRAIRDDRKLWSYLLLSFITLGIYAYYWEYKLQERLRANAPRYGVTTITQGGGTILALSLGGLGLTILLGALTGGSFGWVGTIMSWAATYILIHSLNDLAKAYNHANGVAYKGF